MIALSTMQQFKNLLHQDFSDAAKVTLADYFSQKTLPEVSDFNIARVENILDSIGSIYVYEFAEAASLGNAKGSLDSDETRMAFKFLASLPRTPFNHVAMIGYYIDRLHEMNEIGTPAPIKKKSTRLLARRSRT